MMAIGLPSKMQTRPNSIPSGDPTLTAGEYWTMAILERSHPRQICWRLVPARPLPCFGPMPRKRMRGSIYSCSTTHPRLGASNDRLHPIRMPSSGQSILIATTPHVQQAVANRLKRDGLRPIIWNELIPDEYFGE